MTAVLTVLLLGSVGIAAAADLGFIPLPPIEHQGINHAFEGKAFEVWYYYDGQWLKVAGGD